MNKFLIEKKTGRRAIKRFADLNDDQELLRKLKQLDFVLDVRDRLSKPLSFQKELERAQKIAPDVSFALEKLPLTTPHEVYLYGSILKETRLLHRMYPGEKKRAVPFLIFPDEVLAKIEEFGEQELLVESSMWRSQLESGVTYYHINFKFNLGMLNLYVRPGDHPHDISFDFRSSSYEFGGQTYRLEQLARESRGELNSFPLERRLQMYRSIIQNIEFYASLES